MCEHISHALRTSCITCSSHIHWERLASTSSFILVLFYTVLCFMLVSVSCWFILYWSLFYTGFCFILVYFILLYVLYWFLFYTGLFYTGLFYTGLCFILVSFILVLFYTGLCFILVSVLYWFILYWSLFYTGLCFILVYFILVSVYFLYFPIFPYNLNPPYFFIIFGQKKPIFPYIFSMAAPWSDNFCGVCM